jgi:drug/metabolite transporter (DMT)-like permease
MVAAALSTGVHWPFPAVSAANPAHPPRQAALTGAVVCLAAAVAYCAYSVLSPELQRRKIEAARKKRLRCAAAIYSMLQWAICNANS